MLEMLNICISLDHMIGVYCFGSVHLSVCLSAKLHPAFQASVQGTLIIFDMHIPLFSHLADISVNHHVAPRDTAREHIFV